MTNELVGQASPWVMLIGPMLPLVVEWIKVTPLFPNINPETKKKILAVFSLLSVVGGVGAAALTGQLDADMLSNAIDVVTNFALVMGLGELFYRHVIKRFKGEVPPEKPTPPAGGAAA